MTTAPIVALELARTTLTGTHLHSSGPSWFRLS